MTDTVPTADPTPEPDPVNSSPPRKRHGRLAMVLIVVGSILLPIAGLSVWSRNQLLNTDRYVDTVKPLADDPAVQAAVAHRVAETVLAAVDLEDKAKAALPDKAKFLAAPIAAAAQNLVEDLAKKFLASDQFRALWETVNRRAHVQLVAILEGNNNALLAEEDGKIVVSLQPIVQQVATQLDKIVPVDLTKIPPDRLDVKFVLVDSSDLASVQSGVKWFNRGTWVLLGLAAVALIAGALLTPDKRRGMQRAGAGIVISMAVTLLLYGLARDRYISHLPATVQSPEAATSVFDIMTRYVREGARAILVLGLVLFAAAWVGGPSRSATWVRGRWNSVAKRGSDSLGSHEQVGGIGSWVGAHAHELHAAIVGLAVVMLLLWDHPTGKTVLLLAALVAIAFAVVQLVGGAAPKDTPADTR